MNVIKRKISYDPLWQMMKDCGITGYQLTQKYNFNRGTLYRMQRGDNVNLSTIVELSEIFDCSIEDIVKIER